MTLRPFLQGRTPAPVRPNPGAVEPTSLVALLGTGDPIEWRTERAIWPGVAREMLRFRKALARLDPSLPPGDRVDGRVPWPFHADARGGLLTVEWWGDLAAPMILPVVHGDEAQELVDRYGTDPAGPRQRFAVYRGGLADWWTSARPAKMLDRLRALGASPRGATRAALLVARSVLPLLPPDLGADGLVDRVAGRFTSPGSADEATALGWEEIRLAGDALRLDDSRARVAGGVLSGAIRAALIAEGEGSRSVDTAFTQATEAFKAAETLTDEWQPYARLLRREYEFAPLVELALRAWT